VVNGNLMIAKESNFCIGGALWGEGGRGGWECQSEGLIKEECLCIEREREILSREERASAAER